MGQAAGRGNARQGAAVRRDAPLLLPKLFRGRSRRVSCIGVRNSSQNVAPLVFVNVARPRAGSFSAAAAKQRRRACRTDQRPQPACWLRNLCRGAQHARISHAVAMPADALKVLAARRFLQGGRCYLDQAPVKECDRGLPLPSRGKMWYLRTVE
jgi:hypothetical protein